MKKQGNVILSLLLCVLLVFTTAVPAFAALGTVKGLKAAAVTADSATLKWSAVSGAKGYEVQQASGSGWKSVAVTGKTTAKVGGLRLGNTYQFRVRAYKSGKSGVQYGAPSAAISVLAGPTVKTLKAAKKTSYSLKLKWSAVSGASGYRLQQYVNKQWVNLLKSTKKTDYTLKKLAPNTSYRFRVCAFTGSVSGAWKELKTRTELLGKPQSLKAVKVTDTSLTLQWNKVSTAKLYYVYRVGTNTQKQIAKTTKTSYKLTGLSAATDYMYAVRARTTVNDRNYYSQYSSYLSVRTAPKQAAGRIAAGVTDSAVNLTFSRVDGAEGYEIWKYDDAALKWTYIGASLTTSYTVGDLAPQTNYRFKIRAYHTVNGPKLCGAYSAECKVQTKMAPVSDLRFVNATGTSITLSWNPIATATDYRVDLRAFDEPESKLRPAQADRKNENGRIVATITGLAVNTVYYIYVRPVYGDALGTEKPVVAQTAPAKVTGVAVQSVPGGISLTWPAVAGAQGYEVSKFLYADTWKVIGNTSECSFADSDVVTDTTYTYHVRAYYELGGVKYYGEASDPASEKPLPPAVSGIAASNISETMFLLSWNSPQTTTDYAIKLSESGGAERTLQPYVTVDGGRTTLVVDGLSAGTTYTVKVYNAVNGTQSMPAVLTVTTLPGKVTGLTATALSSDTINLNWTPVRGAAYYEIQTVTESGAAIANIDTHVTALPYQVTGLSASTTYRFRVRAVNSNAGAAQYGVYSDTASAATKAASSTPTTPAAPSNLAATQTATGSTYSVALSWSGVNGVSGYRVMINDGAWRELTRVTTSTYTATGLSAGSYSFYVQSYTGSGSGAVLSNPSNTVSVTLGGGSTPTDPGNPAEDLPTSGTPITGITVKQATDGRHYTLKWDEVSGAFYTVQMRDPQSGRWVTVRSKLTSARVTPDVNESQMGISCSTDADQATTVGWGAVSGASSYEVRNELTCDTGDWITKVNATGTSAKLRLPPDSKQKIRVSAVGPVVFRIYALNAAGTSCLAYKEYTVQNAYLTSCDYTFTTQKAPAFSSSASAGVKEAYALMLTQAVNNTRMESNVRLKAVTEQTATASALGTGENTHTKKTITCNYTGGTGTATVLVQEDGKEDTTSTAFSSLMSIIVPSDGATYLYDQHNLSTFQKYVSDVSVSQSGGKTVISLTIKPESVTTSTGMVYHPGLVGTAVTPENLESFQVQGSGVQSANATVGASTIRATINGNYTLDRLEISNPYKMNVSMRVVLTTTTVTVDTKLNYDYTFTR